jgi:type IV pilus assembly protein PilM
MEMFNKDKIAFDIGTYSTTVVVGNSSQNSILIKDAFSFRNPEGLVDDGHILDPDSLKEEIINHLQDRRFKTKNAVFTIASTKTIMRELVLPYAPQNKIEAMVPFELAKHLPITVEDYIIKYMPLEVFIENKVKNIRLMTVALPKFMVKKYLELCHGIALNPLALTIHMAGASKILQHSKKKDNTQETLALLDLGYSSINCSIIQNGKLVFNRLVSINKKDFSDMEKEQSMDDQKVVAVIDKWIDEIKKVSRFYISLKNGNRIDQVILFGGGAAINNIANYMAEKLERPVHVLRGVNRIRYKGIGQFPLNLYFNAATALLLD